MEQFFKPGSNVVRIFAILYCILGIILMVLGINLLLSVVRVLGFLLSGTGFFLLYKFIATWEEKNTSLSFIGFPSAVFGLILLMSPDSLLTFFPFLVAILLILHSLAHIDQTLRFKKKGYAQWKYGLIAAIVTICLAFLLIPSIISNIEIVLKLVGLGLFIQSIVLFTDDYLYNKYLTE